MAAVQALDVFAKDLGEFEELMKEEPSDQRSAKLALWLFQQGVTEADLAPHVARVDKAVKVPEIVETALATQSKSPMDLALLGAASQLMLERTKEARDRLSTAAAVMSLVAPESVLTRVEQLEKLASSDSRYALAHRRCRRACRQLREPGRVQPAKRSQVWPGLGRRRCGPELRLSR